MAHPFRGKGRTRPGTARILLARRTARAGRPIAPFHAIAGARAGDRLDEARLRAAAVGAATRPRR